MNFEQPRGVGCGFPATGNHLSNLGLLLRGEFWPPAAYPSIPAGRGHPGAGAFLEHGAFELGKGADHLHHEASGGSGGVDGFSQAAESGLGGAEFFHDDEHVAQRAGETIEFPDHQHVFRAELIEETVELRTIPAAAGSFFRKDALAAGIFQSVDLGGSFLIAGGDAGVTEEHCTNVSRMDAVMQYLFATADEPEKGLKREACKKERFCNDHIWPD